MNRGEKKHLVTRYGNGAVFPVEDLMPVEEPLEIFLDGKPFYMTMRLPSDEIPLALGYCFSEGVIDSSDDVLLTYYCEEETGNRVYMTLAQGRKDQTPLKERKAPAYSSCGICGKELIEEICARLQKREFSLCLPVSQIDELISTVIRHQTYFKTTGATHAAAAFDKELRLLAISEDIGRHNAIDKTLGKLLLENKVTEPAIIVTTSRISYEIVQKAARTGAEILIGISSATSLAVELANDTNLTLIGFARRNGGNIYTAVERIIST